MATLLSDLKSELEEREHIKFVSAPTVVQDQFPDDPDRDVWQFTYTIEAANGASSGHRKIRATVFKIAVEGEENAVWQNGKGDVDRNIAEFLFTDGIVTLKSLTNCFNSWCVLEMNYPRSFMLVKALTHASIPADKDVLHQGVWKTFTIHYITSGDSMGWNVSEVPDGGLFIGNNYDDA